MNHTQLEFRPAMMLTDLLSNVTSSLLEYCYMMLLLRILN